MADEIAPVEVAPAAARVPIEENVEIVQAEPQPNALSWFKLLCQWLGFNTWALLLVAIPLCSACGSWLSHRSHPLLFSIIWGTVAANVLCMLAAACWRLRGPDRLYATPAVLLAATEAACAGTAVSHQAWRQGCSSPDWPIILWLAAAPFLAGIAALGLILSERPHWLVLGGIRATAGACLLSWFSSFWGSFDVPALILTLIAGSVMGLFVWPFAWLFVMQHFIPAALLPYAATWEAHGLVADGHEGLEDVPANLGCTIEMAMVLAALELTMFGLACTVKG